MLTTKIILGNNDLPVRFNAVDNDGNILVSARHVLSGKWVVETHVSIEQLASQARHFDHSGPAIEAFTVVVNNLVDYLRQRNEVERLRECLDAAEYRLGDLRNSYYSSMSE